MPRDTLASAAARAPSSSSVALGELRWEVHEHIALLAHDAELAGIVDPAQRGPATRASVARVMHLDVGAWTPPAGSPHAVGLVVIEGLLCRRAGYAGRRSTELLGPGDLLRPWQAAGDGDAVVAVQDTWTVLLPTRLAVADEAWAARMSGWPGVFAVLTGRAVERSHRAAALAAIRQIRQLDERVWLVLWRLAERFGHVHPDGVHLQLPITHGTLAELAGARRPSVSAALARLYRQGRVSRAGNGWRLPEAPPGC